MQDFVRNNFVHSKASNISIWHNSEDLLFLDHTEINFHKSMSTANIAQTSWKISYAVEW